MPELPEVETIKSDLCKNVIGKTIKDVKFLWPGILKGVSLDEFSKKVVGTKIIGVNRRAKNLDMELSNGFYLLFHMKMTGHLIYTDNAWQVDESGKWITHKGEKSPLYDPLNQFIRVIFYLSESKILAFSDLRKFAYIKLLDKKELDKAYDEYGPEPLSSEFTLEFLKNLLQSRKLAIKKVLMDQKNIAGIGNIYADEILWESKIHPLTKANDISDQEVVVLHKAIQQILTMAVKLHGTSTSDFRDTSGKKGQYGDIRKVYRRTGELCPRDKTKIQRITVGGRGTHFCPTCQKLTTDYK